MAFEKITWLPPRKKCCGATTECVMPLTQGASGVRIHMETEMPSSHLYPDPADLHPMFLSGEFDLDDPVPESPFAFGEAMLSIPHDDQRTVFACKHRHAALALQSDAFMFGLLPEQPLDELSDELFLNLGPTEQA
jgi:hypothetical protein